jgi:putative tryptophan/tyrosine transport system substrate-binding protein
MRNPIRRREFITLLGGAAATPALWPLPLSAQQTGRVRQVGILLPTSASDPEWARRIGALTDGLRTLGWIEGQTITFMIRYADGKPERLHALAAELVAAKVEVIVTLAAALTEAIRKAASDIPIVMALAGDAVGIGLVASLARPGGNITGLTSIATETVVKRLQLVKDFSKDWIRVAALFDGNAPAHRLQIKAMEQAAPALGFALQSFPNTSADDVDNNLQSAVKANAQVIFSLDGPLLESHRERIVGFAMRQRLPVIAENRPMLMAGALMSYSANQVEMWRRAGAYVDKILKGAKPADLPVEQPTRFEFVINLKTVKALGLDVPPMLLALTDDVIE